jgi:TPP-dependent indolepyruvate ferredoxin oxidoreductase alpha subunit
VERRKPDSVYQSVEFKQKISNKVTGERNPNYNHKWTDEMKEALREKQKNNPIYRNENNPNAKRIMCVETGECFDCIKYAMEKYNIKTHGSITVALKHPTRTAGGKHWIII